MSVTEIRTYRGRSLEEVLPKIKAELGPDAEIVRQRSGLTGGVGGFFQRQMVEVEARPADESPQTAGDSPQGRRFDAYDDAPAVPEPLEHPADSFVPDPLPVDPPTAEGLSAPGIQEILRTAAPFADQLGAALEPPTSSQPAPPSPQAEPPAAAGALESAMAKAGIDATLAREVIAEVVSHELPFASKRSL